MKITVLLTFDYELPLGSVTSYDKGIFEPTHKLLALADSLEVPVVLFSDICSALKFKIWDYQFYEKFTQQVQRAIASGHDAQLHIHPHWMETTFENGTFKPSPRYGLSDFKNDTEYSIEKIINLGYTALTEICKEVKRDYQCTAFRAGGYNVEPESKRILNALYEHNIKIETSVIPGLYQNLAHSKIDYRNAPTKNFWTIPLNGPLIEEQPSDFIEIPITQMPLSVSYLLSRTLYKQLHKQTIKKRAYQNTGKSYHIAGDKLRLSDKIRTIFNPVLLTFDRDYMNVRHLDQIVSWNLDRYNSQQEVILTAISHPKFMGEYHLNLMKEFVTRMKTKYNASFVTYQDLNLISTN